MAKRKTENENFKDNAKKVKVSTESNVDTEIPKPPPTVPPISVPTRPPLKKKATILVLDPKEEDNQVLNQAIDYLPPTQTPSNNTMEFIAQQSEQIKWNTEFTNPEDLRNPEYLNLLIKRNLQVMQPGPTHAQQTPTGIEITPKLILNKTIQGFKGLKAENTGLINASYLLTSLGTCLLATISDNASYRKYYDPIEFRLNLKTNQLLEKVSTLTSIERLNSKHYTKEKRDIIGRYEEDIKNIQKELESVRELKEEKDDLNKKYGGLFPYIPKKLTPTFITKYIEIFPEFKKEEREIIEKLTKIRETLQPNISDKHIIDLCKFFDIEVKETKGGKIYKNQYKNKVENLEQKIEKVLSKKINEELLEKYSKELGIKLSKEGFKKQLEEIKRLLGEEKITLPKQEEIYQALSKLLELTYNEDKEGKEDFKDSLLVKIENIVGKKLTLIEVSKNILKIKNRELKCATTQEVINKTLKELTSAEKIEELQKHIKEAYKFTIDPYYLRGIEDLSYEDKTNFLVQVCLYKKIGRDMAKSALSLFTGGLEDITLSLPPGGNTTLKMTSGGSITYHLGELGSYKTIGNLNLYTLENYLTFLSDSSFSSSEKEIYFRSLHQIEAIRNNSALLTGAMFFELAKNDFQPLRIIGEIQLKEAELMLKKAQEKKDTKNKEKEIAVAQEKVDHIKKMKNQKVEKYDFSKIADQMPMAMKGAVSGTVYLEQKFVKYMPYSASYDYRSKGEEKFGIALASRDSNLLFDWICYKIGAEDLQNALAKKQTVKEKDKLPGKNCEWIVKSKNTKSCNLQTKEDSFEICFAIKTIKKKEEYSIDKILKFPLTIFDKLIQKWYGLELNALEEIKEPLEISLKASAEPKDPDIDRDNDSNTAILSAEAKQDEIILEYKNLNDTIDFYGSCKSACSAINMKEIIDLPLLGEA